MRRVHLYRDGERLAGPLDLADGFLDRTRGLIGRTSLPGRSGMVIERCGMIHTWFMRFPIDVVFLASDGTVKKVVRGMKPYRFAGALFAQRTVELPAGLAGEIALKKGQIVELREEAGEPP